jgi:hypothetical protein
MSLTMKSGHIYAIRYLYQDYTGKISYSGERRLTDFPAGNRLPSAPNDNRALECSIQVDRDQLPSAPNVNGALECSI